MRVRPQSIYKTTTCYNKPMCARFTLRTKLNLLLQQFSAELQHELAEHENEVPPRYNIAPSQEVLAVRMVDGRRQLGNLQWGLVPSWAKDPKIATINARADSVATKPMFRSAFSSRRCLIPADGYYEWLRVGKQRQPYLYETGRPFALAGLWENWRGLKTCTIITTEANPLAAEIHDRMPVILHESDYGTWLDGVAEDAQELLKPYDDPMTAHEVSTFVNNSRHEGPECVALPNRLF